MRRARHALLALAACTLFACDALLGIDVFPDNGSDASTQGEAGAEAGADATADAHTGGETSADAGADLTLPEGAGEAQSGNDGGADGPDEASESGKGFCIEMCGLGKTRCGATGLQTCEQNDAGCNTWSADVPCASGSTCAGAANDAFCCAGGGPSCLPSCHWSVDADAGDGQSNCGRNRTDSCCQTLDVDGGAYFRSYDGVVNVDKTSPATVSSFALDEFEVTVGRFRQYVRAVADRGWTAASGAGLHSHLNGGNGLVDSSQPPTSYESGWDQGWSAYVPSDSGSWDGYLKGCSGPNMWTTSPGTNEALPINCVSWYVAYSFCIWDGGFLPTEDEWEYAAAGGGASDGQRLYAWSSPPKSTTLDCTYADYAGCGPSGTTAPTLVGGDFKGAGKWGQQDLTGNVWEWTLDYYNSYVTPCIDCAYLAATTAGHTIRGASFDYPSTQLYVADRDWIAVDTRYSNDGFRCARVP